MSTDTMEIRQLARQFAESELRPHLEAWDRDGAVSPEVVSQIEEMGFYEMLESGDFDMPTYVAALEELAWGEPGVALLVAASNAHRVRGPRLALTTDDTGAMFLVPTNESGKRIATMGLRTVEIIAAAGGSQAKTTDNALLGIAAISVGIAQAALDHARSYADIREQFKTRLREFEGIQYKLADMATRTEAARALLNKAVWQPTPSAAAMAKVFASDTAMWVTTEAVQIFGGYGYMRDYPVEKLMREAKATEMLEGTNETLRVRIARELYTQD
jgi:alkylation response protein AidB-like acyl-CoA dehydrogenase